MRDTFSQLHPVVNFLYFGLVLAFSMFLMHPVCLSVSLFCAVFYSFCLKGKKVLRFQVRYLLPLLLFTAVLNPVFNHEGGTILAYFPSGNPLTLEAVAYGVATAVMLASVLSWFTCYNAVMTSDKFVYLFGRMIPALSLILSMTLRFVPRMKTQIKRVAEAQKCTGRGLSSGSLLQKAGNGARIFSIAVTWALENAIDTADSMKSRGYGLEGRTAFSIYRFDGRDKGVLLFLLFSGVYLAAGALLGGFQVRYFPTIKAIGLEPYTASLFLCYLALGLCPVVINMKEDRKWKALQSKI